MRFATYSFTICGLMAVLSGGCARHDARALDHVGSLKDEVTTANVTPAATTRRQGRAAWNSTAPLVTGSPAKADARTEAAKPNLMADSHPPMPLTQPTKTPPTHLAAPHAVSTTPPPIAPPVESKPLPAAPLPTPAPILNNERATAIQLLSDGRKLFSEGKVIDARRRFIAALNGSSPEATWALAQSFDPYYLGKLPAGDGVADPPRSQFLYRTAVERGALGAEQDLKRISQTLEKPQ